MTPVGKALLVIGLLLILYYVITLMFKPNEEGNKNNEPQPPAPVPDAYRIGKLFEDYALKIFPEEAFTIVHKTVGAADLNGRYTEDCINPDYKFRDRATGKEFWVECKYRSHRGEHGAIEWTDQEHLQTYKRIRKETGIKVYVLIGLGGRPDDPQELLFFDLDEKGFATLFYSIQDQLRIENRPYHSLAELTSKT